MSKKRQVSFAFRATQEEMEKIKQLAKEEGRSITSYIIYTCLKKK